MSNMATSSTTSVSGLAPGTPGITPPSNPNRQGSFLTDVIVELGFAGREEVDEAVEAARQLAKTPERYLLETGSIDERQLSIALAERNGLDHVDLDQFQVDMDAASLIDKPIAARYSAVPIAFATDGALLVAIEDPCDMLGVSDIEVMTRNDVRTAIAMGSQIQAVIERLPDRKAQSASDWGQQPAAETEPTAGAEAEAQAEGDAVPEAATHAEGTVGPQAGMQGGPQASPESAPDSPSASAAAPLEPAPAPVQAAPPSPSQPAPPSPSQPGEDDEVELGELSAALRALGDRMREAGDLARTAERRISELEEVDAQAQEAAAVLDDERAEFERARTASAERERQLDAELTAARERIDALERRQSELAGATELAEAAAEQIAELRRVLQA
jgi:hypothetical protein